MLYLVASIRHNTHLHCGRTCGQAAQGMAPRTTSRLTALKVERARERGMYADGGGLYLRVTEDGSKNWVFRHMLDGRPRWMGLGPLASV